MTRSPTSTIAKPEPATVHSMPMVATATLHVRARDSSPAMMHRPSVNDMNDGSSASHPFDFVSGLS